MTLENDLPTPDDLMKRRLADFEDFLKQSLRDVRVDENAAGPQMMFERYKMLCEIGMFRYPKIYDDALQSLQYYSQEMIDALRAHVSEDGFHAAAGIYAKFLETVDWQTYNPDNIRMMVEKNAAWFVDKGGAFDEHMMAAKALQMTFETQEKLLNENTAEKTVIDPEKVAAFVCRTADFIKTLPQATEDGLEPGFLDPKRETHHHAHITICTYSYGRTASRLYYDAVDLLVRLKACEELAAFAQETQPDLSTALADNSEERIVINQSTGEIVSETRFRDTEAALDTFCYPLTMLKKHAPDEVMTYVGAGYPAVSEKLIEHGEVSALIALYDATAAALPERNDARTDFANAWATRNIYQMMKLGAYDEAGIFLNNIHKKSGLPPSHMLLLLDLNGESIVAASLPLATGGKVRSRASVLYDPENGPHMVLDRRRPDEFLSYSASERGVRNKNHFAQQAEELSGKVLANGLTADHLAISKRWRAVDCKNI